MRVQFYPLFVFVLISMALCLAFSDAYGVTCDMLVMNVDDARANLRRAANETDLDAAKNYARRAKSFLDDAAMSAMDCQCHMAHMELDTAASHARRARDAGLAEEFVNSLNRAIRAFNSALDALRVCAAGLK